MNVLFITPPTLSLYTPKRGQEICMGASVLTGYLKNKGHQVHHFDCNIMLSTIRYQYPNLSKEDFISITKKDSLVSILNDEKVSGNLPMAWADWLAMEIIDNCKFETIDQICITLDRRLYTFYPSVSAFSMSLLILKYLDEMGIDVANTPVHMGGLKGLLMLEAYDPTYIKYVFENVNNKDLMPAVWFGRDLHTWYNNSFSLGKIENGTIGEIGYKKQLNDPYDNLYDGEYWPESIPKYADVFTDEVLELNPKLKNTSLKILPFKFTKGCLFKCEFCGDGLRGKKSFRYDPADTIVDGIQRMYDQGYTNFRFFNTNVNFKLSHVIDFCNKIVQRGMKIRWSDSANMAVANQEMFQALADAGCIKLWFGTEHTSERILKQVRKPCTSAEQVHRVLEWSNNVGIWSCCNFIFNFPTETDEEFYNMIDYIAMAREKELMNAYQINSFVLLEDSGYRMYPQKFGIKFRDEFSTTGRHLVYDEVDGKSWEEIQESSAWKERYVEKRLGVIRNENDLRANDAFLFNCYNSGLNKKEIIDLLQKIMNKDKKFKETYMDLLASKIPGGNVYKKILNDIKEPGVVATSRNPQPWNRESAGLNVGDVGE